MSDFTKYYQAADFSAACRAALAAEKARRISGSLEPGPGHAMHITFASRVEGDPTTLGIVTLPLQPVQVQDDGRYSYGWGPVPSDCRVEQSNAGDPVQDGAIVVFPDGSWGSWQKTVGYLEGTGQKPLAAFGPDGIPTQSGFTRGGQYYEVGNKNPVPAPGMPVAGGADVLTLAEELVAAIRASKAS